jgi:hypothetical protein
MKNSILPVIGAKKGEGCMNNKENIDNLNSRCDIETTATL